MNTAQKLIVGSAIVISVGLFVFSDYKLFRKKKSVVTLPKNPTGGDIPITPIGQFTSFAGMAGVTIPRGYVPDPEMMLEVNPETFPNFAGSNEIVLAEKNNPYGENFARKRPKAVPYQQFYAKNRRKC
jgi:hypothetical protein